MQIKVYRGTHQIGGCVTEIKTSNARIIIDMGADLPSADDAANQLEIEGVTYGKPDCDAVLITHYHGDHVGMYEKILPDIPIYMGRTAKQIFAVVQQTLKNKFNQGNLQRVQTFKEFTVGKPHYFKDVKVTPFVIDHSAYDAYMFLIEAEGKRILHTGDFRMHGARGNKMATVFEKYATNIDLLITEGTMLSRMSEKVITEYELGIEAKKLLHDNKNIFVICSSTNVDTIAKFYNAAIENGKPFIVCEDDFQAEILRIVTNSSTSQFYKFNRQIIYTYGKNLHKFMQDKGFVFIGRTNCITKRAIENFPHSLLIYSMWSGYLDNSHPAFDKYKKDFIDDAVSAGCNLQYLHTSGHASSEALKLICAITQAKTVIPIHCEKPEQFNLLGVNAKIRILQDGEVFII